MAKKKPKLPAIPQPARQEAESPPAASQDATAPPADCAPDLSHIHPGLRGLAVRCDSLVFDDANPIEHGEENLASIQGSFEVYGQTQIVVYDQESRRIIVGNGRVRAALLLSAEDPRWQWIAAMPFDGSGGRGEALSVVDNQSARLAKWRPENLKARLEKCFTNANPKLDKLLGDLADKTKLYLKKQADKPAQAERWERWEVIVECTGEAEQKQVFEELQAAGKKCRLITF